MFGPVRGAWSSYDGEWKGWWGDEPPYPAPVFVLTRHGHDPIEIAGGTTFHFVTVGFDAALAQAHEAGHGERIFAHDIRLTLEQVSGEHTPSATHVRYRILH